MVSPVPMDAHEKMRLRAAANRAHRVLPPGVGALVSRELYSWEEFGYRLGKESLIFRAIDEILKAPIYRDLLEAATLAPPPKSEAGRSAVGYGD